MEIKSESRIQQECVVWFNNTYPQYRGLFFEVNNNSDGVNISWIRAKLLELIKAPTVANTKKLINDIRKQTAKEGAKHRALGRIAGVSDAILLSPNNIAIAVEFKADDGRQSKEQKEWANKISTFGYEYVIIRSLDEFKALINKYF